MPKRTKQTASIRGILTWHDGAAYIRFVKEPSDKFFSITRGDRPEVVAKWLFERGRLDGFHNGVVVGIWVEEDGGGYLSDARQVFGMSYRLSEKDYSAALEDLS